MYNELTRVDIRKMEEEIEYKMKVVRPKCIEDLKTARAFGDLSENYEYKAAKQELRRCDSRLRYLRRMIATARVVEVSPREDTVQLFDHVQIYYPEDDETETIQLMTTLRQDAESGIISRESPLGKAILGHRVGDTVTVRVNADITYPVEIRAITKGDDDDSLPIATY